MQVSEYNVYKTFFIIVQLKQKKDILKYPYNVICKANYGIRKRLTKTYTTNFHKGLLKTI